MINSLIYNITLQYVVGISVSINSSFLWLVTESLSVLLLVPWFVGCYNHSEVADDSAFEPSHDRDQMTPVSCVSLCAFNEK